MRSGNECIGISVFVKLVQRIRSAMGVGHFRFVLFCNFVSGNLRPWQTKFSLLKLSLISTNADGHCCVVKCRVVLSIIKNG
jgi:hypothetical protein